jgi:hypothetical protein
LRIAIVFSKIVNERQRYGNRRIRLDLLNGMRIAALTNVTDESRTMLENGLAQARTNAGSVNSALPFTFYRNSVANAPPVPHAMFLCEHQTRVRDWDARKKQNRVSCIAGRPRRDRTSLATEPFSGT